MYGDQCRSDILGTWKTRRTDIFVVLLQSCSLSYHIWTLRSWWFVLMWRHCMWSSAGGRPAWWWASGGICQMGWPKKTEQGPWLISLQIRLYQVSAHTHIILRVGQHHTHTHTHTHTPKGLIKQHTHPLGTSRHTYPPSRFADLHYFPQGNILWKCDTFHFQMSCDLSVTDEDCTAGSPIRASAEVTNVMRMGHSTQKVTPFT